MDDSLGDEVRVTVIAAGFEGGSRPVTAGGAAPRRGRHHLDDDAVPGASGDTGGASELGSTPLGGSRREESPYAGSAGQAGSAPASPPPAPSTRRRDEDDDIDVPPFMRH